MRACGPNPGPLDQDLKHVSAGVSGCGRRPGRPELGPSASKRVLWVVPGTMVRVRYPSLWHSAERIGLSKLGDKRKTTRKCSQRLGEGFATACVWQVLPVFATPFSS